MQDVQFRPARSLTRNVDIIEVWYKDRFIATICPPPDGVDMAAITIISKHLRNSRENLFIEAQKEPPVLFVRFDPFAD